ncbi:MAG: AarF/UbiB family protein [Chromatocurvus sp.]
MSTSGIIDRGVRAARIGLAVRNMKNSDDPETREKARRALAAMFADSRGVTMKFGQLMAAGEDGEAFRDLVGSIEPLPLSAMLPVIEAELGRSIAEVFSEIRESEHAASLGQVHRATLLDGTDVAVKVQYPFIADAIDAEMRLFGLMPGVGPVRKWGFDLDGYKRALKENMSRELDYRNEAERQMRFREAVRIPGLVVPKVFPELSTARVLTQAWESGVPLSSATSWSVEERASVGRILLGTLLASMIEVGEVHGDPHAGNFAFRKRPDGSPEVVLMDFGCTVPVARAERLALLRTIIAVREGEDLNALNAFAAMGFEAEKLALISGGLGTLAHILFAPFKHQQKFFIQHWDLKARFESLLGENRWWFRASGPPAHILLLRGFFGLAQQLHELRAGMPWWEVMNASLSPALIAEARHMTIPPVAPDITARAQQIISSVRLADHLRVRVSQGGINIVDLSMPAEAVLRLEELIPEETLNYLRDSDDWDLPEIMADIRAHGVSPREIMQFEKGPKQYRIWLS